MKPFRLTAIVVLLSTALLCFSCGGSGSPSGRPNPGKVPTATLPAVLPDPLIVSGTPAAPAAPSGDTYTVKSGDTPSAIAERLGVSVDELMSLNSITDPTQLAVGQVLRIPSAKLATPAPGRTPAASTPTPKATSATSTPRPAATPREGETTYTVQSGDNANDIALRFGITVEELAAANNTTVDNLRSLQVGDVLVIPASSITATPAPAEEPTSIPPIATPET
jgi:LysM repeat protein